VYPKAPFTIITVTTAIFYLYSSLQKHSINTDALTGLNNRNRMEQYLSQRIDHADHNPFYLFIADVDCFKQINDTYGHVAGDEALSTVATALKAQGKKYRSFFACRYGGDEFVFTIDKSEVASLREKPDAIVVSINEAIRQQIDQKNMQYQLRLSAGMAEVNRTDSDISDLIHQADEELYKEKNEIHDTKGFRGIRSNR
jgi:diguanylate cyclase (GGDEF)-like protein